MNVICEIAFLKSNRIADYVELHRRTCPSLVRGLREGGIEDFESANAKLARNAVFMKWDRMVRPMFSADRRFLSKTDLLIDLKPIWRLDDFDRAGVPKPAAVGQGIAGKTEKRSAAPRCLRRSIANGPGV